MAVCDGSRTCRPKEAQHHLARKTYKVLRLLMMALKVQRMLLQFSSLETGGTYVVPVHSLRYPLVGGTRQRYFDETNSKPRKLPENAPTPTSRVHAVLGGLNLLKPQLQSPLLFVHGNGSLGIGKPRA